MKPCCFETCITRARHRRHGITFHEFPTIEEIRTKWVAMVRNDRHDPRWTPTAENRVCSLHFSRSQFLSKRVLHSRAVPTTKFEPPQYLRPFKHASEDQEDIECIDLDNDIPDVDLIPIPEGNMPVENGEFTEAKNDVEGYDNDVGEAKDADKMEEDQGKDMVVEDAEGNALEKVEDNAEDKAEGKVEHKADEEKAEAMAKDKNEADHIVEAKCGDKAEEMAKNKNKADHVEDTAGDKTEEVAGSKAKDEVGEKFKNEDVGTVPPPAPAAGNEPTAAPI